MVELATRPTRLHSRPSAGHDSNPAGCLDWAGFLWWIHGAMTNHYSCRVKQDDGMYFRIPQRCTKAISLLCYIYLITRVRLSDLDALDAVPTWFWCNSKAILTRYRRNTDTYPTQFRCSSYAISTRIQRGYRRAKAIPTPFLDVLNAKKLCLPTTPKLNKPLFLLVDEIS